MDEIINLLEKGESITAMRMIMKQYGYGIIQAKRIVEDIIERKYGGITDWRDHLRKKRIKVTNAQVARTVGH